MSMPILFEDYCTSNFCVNIYNKFLLELLFSSAVFVRLSALDVRLE